MLESNQRTCRRMVSLHAAASAAALLALTTWCHPCRADVGDFAPCIDFFYSTWPPKGLPGVPICQRYLNKFRFASLYSRPRRAPWFSAYVFTPPAGRRPKEEWKYEPQLAYAKADGNMVPFSPGKVDQNVVESQAVQLDYINSSYTRGHLNPSLHHQDLQDKESTFTLTNVVPQKLGSNDGPWAWLEKHVSQLLTKHCKGHSYIVTGVIPYQTDRWLKGDRVAVPEYLWSAYCCPNYNKNLPVKLANTFPTFAAIGRNDPNSTEEVVPIDRGVRKEFWGYDVRLMPLATLEMYLQQRFGTVFTVFYNRCSEP
ncbi:endonuclease domain-containing 1 protein-like [Megalops cyprinoides]|uniref:endonuclease domain-containing 1 protein-like n=1 Tax=Megalops cyprinoides TaxID=118141 RepID=UPI001864A1FB|nr:endonuclease domain-containing 1 protein-like [Megalops cyprinoides]